MTDDSQEVEVLAGEPAAIDKVQCPNCCKLAPVTSRNMGLWFYRCELCETFGAVPDPNPVA